MPNTFEEDAKIKNNLSYFEGLGRSEANIESQLTEYVNIFNKVISDVGVDKQTELNDKKIAFVNRLKNILGL